MYNPAFLQKLGKKGIHCTFSPLPHGLQYSKDRKVNEMNELLNYTEHRTAPLPSGPWMMFQKWEEVVTMHIPVDPEELSRHVPDELELDLYEGRAWISIFPFNVKDLKFRNIPRFPYFHKFLELNTRTYVKHKGIPGVYFFSLDAEKIIPVLGARTATLPYYKAKMKRENKNGWTHFYSRRQHDAKAWFDGRYKVLSSAAPSEAGTLDHWLFERYRLYKTLGGKVMHIGIHHLKWKLADVSVDYDPDSVNSLLPGDMTGEPVIAHYCPELDVLFWPPYKSE